MQIRSVCLGQLATNCYLVTVPNATIVIDPAEDGPALESFLADTKVDVVVNTHGHFDHVGGAWALREQGAEVLMHEADLPLLDEFMPEHGSIDRFVGEGDMVADALRVMHLPGHSPGGIALVGDDVAFVGDVLFSGSIGRTDLPGGSPSMMRASLKRIQELIGTYRIYPGHGPPTTLSEERDHNPFLKQLAVS